MFPTSVLCQKRKLCSLRATGRYPPDASVWSAACHHVETELSGNIYIIINKIFCLTRDCTNITFNSECRVQNSHNKCMLTTYMKNFVKLLALHHNASFYNICFIIMSFHGFIFILNCYDECLSLLDSQIFHYFWVNFSAN